MREYSPSSKVDDIEPFLERYAAESARVRETVAFKTHRYGPGPRAELDLFRAEDRCVHAFIHGGYWQQLSKGDASFPAEGFVAAGITYAAVGYDLCPEVTLRDIVGQVGAAISYLRSEYPDADLTVSGSSAGAHLAATASRSELVDRLVLLSGIYDLRPLVPTYVNDLVGLDDTAAAELSPLLLPPPGIPTRVVWGENETEAFKRQSTLYAVHVDASTVQIPGRNHFDIVHDLPAIAGVET
ncbi:MAG: alpha/beta hydrolase [Acidimicrobiales bacterium]|nr:alpha/beta hydrolase [Acidimicrobiales bacterium]